MLAGTTAALVVATNLPWLGRFELVQRDAWAVFWAALLICTVGVADDLFELGAIAKLAGQTLAAGIVVLNGVKFYWIPLPDRIIALDNVASIAVAVFVILVCVNAINLMDGLDGLAAGVVGIGAGAFFVYAYLLSYEQDLVRATTSSLLTVAVVGVCLGFLPHNIHRARMFMGDSGSMLLGFLLATSMISLTGQLDPSRVNPSGRRPHLVLPAAAAADRRDGAAVPRPGDRLHPPHAGRAACGSRPTSSTCTTACSSWGTPTAWPSPCCGCGRRSSRSASC